MKKIQSGFTFFEFLIVVIIVAILSAIFIPSYRQYKTEEKRNDIEAAFKEIEENIYFRDKHEICWGYSIKLQNKYWVPCKNVEEILENSTRSSQ